jgi:hypothetical protein
LLRIVPMECKFDAIYAGTVRGPMASRGGAGTCLPSGPPLPEAAQRGPDRGSRKPLPGRPGVICDIVVTGVLRRGSPGRVLCDKLTAMLCPQG